MKLPEESLEEIERRLALQVLNLEDMMRARLAHFRIQAVRVNALLESAQAGEKLGGVYLAAGSEQIREALKLIESTWPAELNWQDGGGVGDAAIVADLALQGAYRESLKARGYQVKKTEQARSEAHKKVEWLVQVWQATSKDLAAMVLEGEAKFERWKRDGYKEDDLGVLLEGDGTLAHERAQMARLRTQWTEKTQEATLGV